MIPLQGYSYFLLGRDPSVGQLLGPQMILAEHETVSGQHAALQFRTTSANLDRMTVVRDDPEGGDDECSGGSPYFVDLFSTNGSWLNGKRLEPNVYYRLISKDVLRFALCDRCRLAPPLLTLPPLSPPSLGLILVLSFAISLAPPACERHLGEGPSRDLLESFSRESLASVSFQSSLRESRFPRLRVSLERHLVEPPRVARARLEQCLSRATLAPWRFFRGSQRRDLVQCLSYRQLGRMHA